MSGTPRTDAMKAVMGCRAEAEYFARTLERELAKETVRANEAEKERIGLFEEAARAYRLYNAETRDKAALMESIHQHQDLQWNAERQVETLTQANEQLHSEVQGLKDYNRDQTAQMLRNDQGAQGEILRLRTALETSLSWLPLIRRHVGDVTQINLTIAQAKAALKPGAQTDGEAGA